MQKNVKLGLAYLFPIIAPLIILFAVKDNDEDDRRQLGQALVYDIALCIVMIIFSVISIIPLIGILFRIINYVLGFTPIILGILYFVGKSYEIPVLYDLGTKLVSSVK